MKKPKLTEWFPGHVKPVREGVYLRKVPAGERYAYWNGKSWNVSAETPKGALCNKWWRSKFQSAPWKGILK